MDGEIESMFLMHEVSLRGYLLGLMADRSAADDVFQEVFLVVMRRGSEFRRDGNFLAWVRGIAHNKVREHYRSSRKSMPFDEHMVDLLAAAAPEEADPLVDQRRKVLSQCLDRLAPRTRQIVDLRYAEKPMSIQEIADRICWTTGAVNVALSKARSFLRKCASRTLEQTGDGCVREASTAA